MLVRQVIRASAKEADVPPNTQWYNLTEEWHVQTFASDGRLNSLSEEWQRELAALWRLEADVNNGAYLQFLQNWGKDSYFHAYQGLKKIGANRMAEIIDQCQTLVDEHFDWDNRDAAERRQLMPNTVIDREGKKAGSLLPDAVVERIMQLSYEFMEYPEDLAVLGMSYYRNCKKDGNS